MVGVVSAVLLLHSFTVAHADVLTKLECVTIIAEKPDSEALAFGITRAGLEDAALVDLKSKMPRLEISPLSGGCPNSLLVGVDVGKQPTGGFYGAVQISLWRAVVVVGTGERTEAIVWRTGSIILGTTSSASDQVRKMLGLQIDEFGAKYYKAGNK